MRATHAADAVERAAKLTKEALESAKKVTEEEGRLIREAVEGEFPARLEKVLAHNADRFNEDDFFKERVAEALAVKESVRLALGDAQAWAAETLDQAPAQKEEEEGKKEEAKKEDNKKKQGEEQQEETARRARDMAVALQGAERLVAHVPLKHGEAG